MLLPRCGKELNVPYVRTAFLPLPKVEPSSRSFIYWSGAYEPRRSNQDVKIEGPYFFIGTESLTIHMVRPGGARLLRRGVTHYSYGEGSPSADQLGNMLTKIRGPPSLAYGIVLVLEIYH
jgi:hypothetical protein